LEASVTGTPETQEQPASERTISALIARMRGTQEEHERRLASDPEYRAVHEQAAREEREREEQLVSWRAEQDRRAHEKRREGAGIPRRLWRLLDGTEPLLDTEAMAAVRAFLGSGKTFLVLAGGVGPGKTVAAAWAVEQRRGRMVKAIDLTRLGTYDEERWDELRSCPLLAIDDLGTEPRDEKGWAAANFEALLDHRYDWQAPTVLTTNLPFDAFKARYLTADGGRLRDRFMECGEFVEISEGSRRVVQP
jgi:DNA replication protein DnaC